MKWLPYVLIVLVCIVVAKVEKKIDEIRNQLEELEHRVDSLETE